MNNRGDQNPNNRICQSFAVFTLPPPYSDLVERVLYALIVPGITLHCTQSPWMSVHARVHAG